MAPEMALPEEEILEVEDGVPPWVVLLRWAEVLLMALPDVLPELLSEGAQTLPVDLGEILPAGAVLPGLVDQVLHLNQGPQIEPADGENVNLWLF